MEDLGDDVVVVLDRVDHRVDPAAVVVEVGLERGQVVGLRVANRVREGPHLGHADLAVRRRLGGLGLGARPGQRGGHVEAALLDRQGVGPQGLLLGLGDIGVGPVGQRQDRGDANDADGPRERGHQRAPLLGHQVVERQGQGGEESHRRAAHGFRGAPVLLGGDKRRGIGDDGAVGQFDDARRVLVSELGIVGHHDDQAVAGDVAQEVHDLDAGLGVEGTRGLVGEQDFGIVDEGAGDGNALHLAARHLRGLLVDVVLQAHALQGLQRPGATLRTRHARESERELNVRQDALVRDQVVGLEDEADTVVAVGIPVAGLVVLRRDPIDDEVATLEAIQAADDVEHRGLARTGLAQDGHELVVAEGNRDLVECDLHQVGGLICLDDPCELKHASSLLAFLCALPA